VFGPFCLDPSSTRLLRDGKEIELRPQAFQALWVLVQNGGRPVDYQQMIREAWDGVVVSRHTVAVTVGEVKKALREYGSWITCRPGLGYRLEAPKCEALIRKGRHFTKQRTREGLERAVACFQEAARDDGGDFRGFEGLARCHLILGACGMSSPGEMYSAFLDAHQQAVALAGLTPELQTDRGFGLHMFERRAAEAESDLLEAQRRQPTLAATHTFLAMLYTALGRLDDAVRMLDEGYRADALWPILPATEVLIRFCRREFDSAVACGKKALELHPYVQFSHAYYAQALEYSGHTEQALAQYRHACLLCPDMPWLRALEGAGLARGGRRAEAMAIARELERRRAAEYVDAYYMALLHEALGRRDEAFGELERAYEEGSTALPILDVDPKMDPLRSDRRFARLSRLAAPRRGAAAGGAVPGVPPSTDRSLRSRLGY
jgi:DNA-binding winged helix-turn-helix (wHTH) protein/Flp pilus assembly protein TadD